MAIKMEYASKEEIPAAHAELYTDKGGKWVLTGVEGVEKASDYDAMRANLKLAADKERTRAAELERKVKVLGDKDPEELLRAMEELEELKAAQEEGGQANANSAEAKKLAREMNSIRRKLDDIAKDRDAALARAMAAEGAMRDRDLESAIRSAAIKAKIRPEAIDDILRYKTDFEIEDGKVRSRDTGLDPEVWFSDMKEKRPHWWPGSSGGGAGGGSGVNIPSSNPFDPKNPNMSKINELVGTDPAKAAQYAAAAGFPSVTDAIRALGTAAGRAANAKGGRRY